MFWSNSDNLFLVQDHLGFGRFYLTGGSRHAARERIVKVDVSDMESQTVSKFLENYNNFGRSACLAVKASDHNRIYIGGSINDGHQLSSDPIRWGPAIKLLDSSLNVVGSWLLRMEATTEDYSGAPDNDETKHTYVDHLQISETEAGGEYYLFGTTRSTDIANAGTRIFFWKAYLDSQDMIDTSPDKLVSEQLDTASPGLATDSHVLGVRHKMSISTADPSDTESKIHFILFSPSLEMVYYGRNHFALQTVIIVPIATGITMARESFFTSSGWGPVDSLGSVGAQAYTVGWTT